MPAAAGLSLVPGRRRGLRRRPGGRRGGRFDLEHIFHLVNAVRQDHHCGVAYGELITRAKAHGVCASYLNWKGERVEVHQDALAAILDALGDPSELAGQLVSAGLGASRSAGRPRIPRTRSWGFMVQLYSLRSRRSWGHGDLRDLADLARWAGRVLGASFILINPLHATEPTGPVSNSPYRAMSRRFVSPLYLRIEDIEESETTRPAWL